MKVFYAMFLLCCAINGYCMQYTDNGFDKQQTERIKTKLGKLREEVKRFKDNMHSKQELINFLDPSNPAFKSIIQDKDIYVQEYLKECVKFTKISLSSEN